MKKKLISLILGIVLAVIIFGFLVWFFVFKPKVPSSEFLGEKIKGGPKATGQINDEIYIELMARSAYGQQKDIEKWFSENGWQKLLEEYKITQQQYDEYVQNLVNDQEKFRQLQQKWYQRYLEIKASQNQQQ